MTFALALSCGCSSSVAKTSLSSPTLTAGAVVSRDPEREREPSPLASVVALLAQEVVTRSPDTELALAVRDFSTNEYVAINDDEPHVSASSAKAIWVAAALKKVGVEPVAPHADAIFESSSNQDATEIIKLAGPDFINDFYASAGMTRSAFTQWFGQASSTSPRLLGNDNYVTARDAVSFLDHVHHGSLLDPSSNAMLEEWLTWTPRVGFGGWLGSLLPADAQPTLMHKAGWLPPPYQERSVNEIGLVTISANHAYAIAILARHASNYELEQRFVEHASCAVFRTITARLEMDCE